MGEADVAKLIESTGNGLHREMQSGFARLDKRMDGFDKRMDGFDRRLAHVRCQYHHRSGNPCKAEPLASGDRRHRRLERNADQQARRRHGSC